jgi:predicted Na+-dependent transporter
LLWLDKLTKVLVLVLLIEMMVAAGLGVSLSDLVTVLRNAPLLISAGLANYVVVRAIFISLLYAFRANPMVALGFLMVGSVRVLRLQFRLQRWPKAMSRFPSA